MEAGNCRDCGRPVLWARTAAHDKRIPLDAEPDMQRGNVVVTALGRAYAFRDREAALAFQERTDDEYLSMSGTYLAHAASCPKRQRDPRERERQVPSTPQPVQLGLL